MKESISTGITFLLFRPVFLLILKFFPLTITGLENVNRYKNQRIILAGNHTGFLDGPIVLAAINRPVLFITAQHVLHWPVVGWFVKRAGVLSLHPSLARSALQKAIINLNQGHLLCIFPEGGLTRDGQLADFQNGAAFLSQKTQTPIIPFAIEGGYEAWPWGQKCPIFRPVSIRFGKAIEFELQQNKAEITKNVRNQVIALMT